MRIGGAFVAVLGVLFMGAVMIVNQLLKPDPATPGAWLFDGASGHFFIICAAIAGVWYAGWFLFVAYQRLLDSAYPNRHCERAMARLAKAAAEDSHSRPAATVRPHRRPPPTAPMPVVPDDEPTVTINSQ